jgi:hypothetical protein
MEVFVQVETWAPTGLWLPAGSVAEVELAEVVNGLHIQVGSHTDDLSRRNGPYRRWPSVVVVQDMNTKVTKLATPFGGIVYLATHLAPEQVEPVNLTATFRGFCRHPMANRDNPDAWTETKDFDVPWGEIVIGSLSFTLPAKAMREIGEFEPVFARYTTVLEQLWKFMGSGSERDYRVVFDVDLADEGPQIGYPLLYRVESIEGILRTIDRVSDDLFSLLSLLAIWTLRDCFDSTTEAAIAAIAASVICQSLFPAFDPLSLAGFSLPILFTELWEIHSHVDNTVISRTLATFQDPNYDVPDVPEDMWISFVKELSKHGKRNFTKLLERAKPIPLNVAVSLQGLPEYQPKN